MAYSDIKTKDDFNKCVWCREKLNDSPWSICYDPLWKRNVWGGDSHKYKALLCQDCASELLKSVAKDI